MGQSFLSLALEPDRRTGDYLLLTDTVASLGRIGIALVLSATLAIAFGLIIGVIPFGGAVFGPLVGAMSLVPPLALLPILFIALGWVRFPRSL